MNGSAEIDLASRAFKRADTDFDAVHKAVWDHDDKMLAHPVASAADIIIKAKVIAYRRDNSSYSYLRDVEAPDDVDQLLADIETMAS